MKTTFTIPSAMCLAALPAMAGTTVTAIQPAPAASPWSCRVSLYGWLESLSGDTGVRGYDLPLDISFNELVEYLDFAAMGTMELGYDRWSFVADMMYAKLGDSISGNHNDSVDLDMKQFLGNFVVAYELVKTDTYKLDAYAGARVNYLSLDLNVKGPRGNKFSRHGSETWVDPIVGTRFQAELPHNFFFRAVGDIGGFGAASELTWQASGGFGYHITPSSSILLGYRVLGTDYTSGGFTWDITTQGFILGYEYKF